MARDEENFKAYQKQWQADNKDRIEANRKLRMEDPVRRARVNERQVRVQQARRELLSQIKLEVGCIVCGFNEHPAALDFDHRPDEVKLFNVSVGYMYGLDRVMAEIAKCDVVCANHHRIRTAERGYVGNGVPNPNSPNPPSRRSR